MLKFNIQLLILTHLKCLLHFTLIFTKYEAKYLKKKSVKEKNLKFSFKF